MLKNLSSWSHIRCNKFLGIYQSITVPKQARKDNRNRFPFYSEQIILPYHYLKQGLACKWLTSRSDKDRLGFSDKRPGVKTIPSERQAGIREKWTLPHQQTFLSLLWTACEALGWDFPPNTVAWTLNQKLHLTHQLAFRHTIILRGPQGERHCHTLTAFLSANSITSPILARQAGLWLQA